MHYIALPKSSKCEKFELFFKWPLYAGRDCNTFVKCESKITNANEWYHLQCHPLRDKVFIKNNTVNFRHFVEDVLIQPAISAKIYFILYKTYCLPKERSDHPLRSKFQASTLPLMKY